jgi:hypothetical protein
MPGYNTDESCTTHKGKTPHPDRNVKQLQLLAQIMDVETEKKPAISVSLPRLSPLRQPHYADDKTGEER